uniref:Uncharacterized protein n=1 Tax=Anguilla anguilla TaxID=7936 RepID=A0A0E9V3E9_ANGAN
MKKKASYVQAFKNLYTPYIQLNTHLQAKAQNVICQNGRRCSGADLL